MTSKPPPPRPPTLERRPPPPSGGKRARLFAALAVIAVIAIVAYVFHSVRGPGDEGPRRMFDPDTTDRNELRRVTEAVSRIIAAQDTQQAAAIETLESVRVVSAGALDLKESCVNTYRGMMRAQQLLAQAVALEGIGPDGGSRDLGQLSMQEREQAMELHRQTSEQIELVESSKDRCHDLYIAAARELGLVPAERSRH